MSAIILAVALLKNEEGLRLDPYKCTQGKWTCWYGRNYEDHPLDTFETTRLLSMGNTKEFATWLLGRETEDLHSKMLGADWYSIQDDARQAALISMAYQMGLPGLRKFHDTLDALERKDYSAASANMLDSLWARQTPARAKRHANIILTGEVPT